MTPSALHSRTVSLPDTLLRLWQSLTGEGRRTPETLAHLSPHMRRDIGLDGRLSGQRTAADLIGRHGLAP